MNLIIEVQSFQDFVDHLTTLSPESIFINSELKVGTLLNCLLEPISMDVILKFTEKLNNLNNPTRMYYFSPYTAYSLFFTTHIDFTEFILRNQIPADVNYFIIPIIIKSRWVLILINLETLKITIFENQRVLNPIMNFEEMQLFKQKIEAFTTCLLGIEFLLFNSIEIILTEQVQGAFDCGPYLMYFMIQLFADVNNHQFEQFVPINSNLSQYIQFVQDFRMTMVVFLLDM